MIVDHVRPVLDPLEPVLDCPDDLVEVGGVSPWYMAYVRVMATDSSRSEVVPLRALNQPSKIAEQVEAGATLIVTRNGRPIMGIVPIERLDEPVHQFRTDPMGDLDIPDLDLPPVTDEEIGATLRGMGGGLDD